MDGERDVVVDVDAGRVEDDAQVLDGEHDVVGHVRVISLTPPVSRSMPMHGPRQAVGHQVGADREDADQQDRHEHGLGLHGDADPVLVDHQAPVGGRRLQAEAEEARAPR